MMLRKLGGFFFFFIVIVAAIGIAHLLSEMFYEKSLIALIKDILFLLTRK